MQKKGCFLQSYVHFQELLRDSQVHFLQLNSVEVATQLTLEDFSTFRQIEPTEYIDDLFEVSSKYGIPQLSKFAEVCTIVIFILLVKLFFLNLYPYQLYKYFNHCSVIYSLSYASVCISYCLCKKMVALKVEL